MWAEGTQPKRSGKAPRLTGWSVFLPIAAMPDGNWSNAKPGLYGEQRTEGAAPP